MDGFGHDRRRDDAPAALDSLREALLEQELDRALLRAAGLEADAASLRAELDAAARALAGALAARDPLGRYPAAARAAAVGALSLVQRRDAWLAGLSGLGLAGGPVFALGPHAGGDDPLTILVAGAGGIGDALYLSTVVRALHAAFPAPRVVVLHDHPAAPAVLGGNPWVLDVVVLRDAAREAFLDHCHALDVFDLIADVRYAVSYATPPLSRVPPDFLRVAHARAAPWQRYVRFDWPHRNNALARAAAAQGLSKLDLLGLTGNLAVDRHAAPDFFPAPAAAILAETATAAGVTPDPLAPLRGHPYATVHHGAARTMAGAEGLQTKNLPLATWAEIAAGLRAAGWRVVQLGEAEEQAVPGADLDLRGRTDLAGTARALRHAGVHVDTEGGLVHLARAVRTPSVVLFGPTPAGFFGYPANANLPPPTCGGCWWTSRDWAARCPLGHAAPPCMAGHDPRAVLAAVEATAARAVEVALAAPAPLPAGPGGGGNPIEALAEALARWLADVPAGAPMLVDSPALLDACLARPGVRDAAPLLLAPVPAFEPVRAAAAAWDFAVTPARLDALPLESGGHAGACALLAAPLAAEDLLAVAAELRRVAAEGAPAELLLAAAPPTRDVLAAAAAAWPGGRVRFALAPPAGSTAAGACAVTLGGRAGGDAGAPAEVPAARELAPALPA